MGIGRTVLDRYLLVRPIGQGGVSLIYEAIDTELLRTAAVKVLSPEFLDHPHTLSAARREAAIMRRLRHPSVPVVYGAGEVPLRRDDAHPLRRQSSGTSVPCVAMELLSGAPLARRLDRGPLDWRDAVHCAGTIADLLAVAHRRGVVHRDLTASNIMLTRSGLKIIDFGLAVTHRGDQRDAQHGRNHDDARGDNHCIGPQAGHPADDVHALGVLLYQMLTGRSPYPNAGPRASLALARFGIPAPAPVLLVPGLPRAVADVCRRCLSKRPADRPESAVVALELWSVLLESAPTESARSGIARSDYAQ